jgi:hypothetical protein
MERFDELLSGIHSATVTSVSVLVREVRVRIGVLTRPVTIRIYRDDRASDPYVFELSAQMRTASGIPRDAHRGAATENEALRRAVRMLTQDYDDAVRSGQLPDDTWLVQSERV